MARIPRLLPLIAVAIGGVVAVRAVGVAPGLFEGARAWAEEAAAHLVKRSYSEPRWSRSAGGAVADERVTLYGIPLVAGRQVPLGRIDPETARDLFIRTALVEEDWDTRHEFSHANRKLVKELGQLEARARRRDILVDDETLVEFYDQRIPAEVVSGAHFDSWWKQARREQPDLSGAAAEGVTHHERQQDLEGADEAEHGDDREDQGAHQPRGAPDVGDAVHHVGEHGAQPARRGRGGVGREEGDGLVVAVLPVSLGPGDQRGRRRQLRELACDRVRDQLGHAQAQDGSRGGHAVVRVARPLSAVERGGVDVQAVGKLGDLATEGVDISR